MGRRFLQRRPVGGERGRRYGRRDAARLSEAEREDGLVRDLEVVDAQRVPARVQREGCGRGPARADRPVVEHPAAVEEDPAAVIVRRLEAILAGVVDVQPPRPLE